MATGAQPFPKLTPSGRQYKPGEIPMSEFVSLDGTKTHLRYGNKRTDAQLSLSFTNLNDEEAGWILDHYRIVTQNWDTADEKTRWVTFSNDGMLKGVRGLTEVEKEPGYSSDLRAHISSGSGGTDGGLKWRYSSAPTVTSVFPGISNVSCSFVACLDSP